MIYLDNAATTRPCAEAVAAVNDALTARWGNPSAVHRLGIEAARLLRTARQDVAEAMGVDTAGMDQEAYRKAAVDAVRQLSVDVGIPTKLDKIKEEDLDFLAQSAAADACAPGNPREASVEDIKGLIRELM